MIFISIFFFNILIDSIFLMPSFNWFHSFVQQGKKVVQKVDVRIANVFIVFLKLDLVLQGLIEVKIDKGTPCLGTSNLGAQIKVIKIGHPN